MKQKMIHSIEVLTTSGALYKCEAVELVEEVEYPYLNCLLKNSESGVAVPLGHIEKVTIIHELVEVH